MEDAKKKIELAQEKLNQELSEKQIDVIKVYIGKKYVHQQHINDYDGKIARISAMSLEEFSLWLTSP